MALFFIIPAQHILICESVGLTRSSQQHVTSCILTLSFHPSDYKPANTIYIDGGCMYNSSLLCTTRIQFLILS